MAAGRGFQRGRAGARRLLGVLLCGVLLLAAGCGPTISSEDRGDYQPTSRPPREAGAQLVGPLVYTVDARSKTLWTHFDFSRGSVVAGDEEGLDWDIAFRRNKIKTNGGATNPRAQAGLIDLGPVDFARVTEAPAGGYALDVKSSDRMGTENPLPQKWYDYNPLGFTLKSKNHTYAVRTADGRYAKFRILNYYCNRKDGGCVTIEYVYQGDGSRRLAAP
ncbi:MAG: HmuY family protein [Candidatus Tectomicrobia bacterium]|nr:HmuY family protein [Candidatus Tectomicrobia bacterium]